MIVKELFIPANISFCNDVILSNVDSYTQLQQIINRDISRQIFKNILNTKNVYLLLIFLLHLRDSKRTHHVISFETRTTSMRRWFWMLSHVHLSSIESRKINDRSHDCLSIRMHWYSVQWPMVPRTYIMHSWTLSSRLLSLWKNSFVQNIKIFYKRVVIRKYLWEGSQPLWRWHSVSI